MPQVAMKHYEVEGFKGVGFLFEGEWYCFPASTASADVRRACFVTDGTFIGTDPAGITGRGLNEGPVEHTFEVVEKFDLDNFEEPVVVGMGQDNQGDLVIYYEGEWYGFAMILQEPWASIFSPEMVVATIVEGSCVSADEAQIKERGLKFPDTISHIAAYDKSKF